MALDPLRVDCTLHCSAAAVFVVIQSLAVGLEKSSGNTGDSRNLLVIRRGATAESTSTPEQYRIIRYLQGIERDSSGVPLASSDLSLVINVPREGRGEANAIIRGVSPLGAKLRPQVRLTAGRWFTPGKREVIVSERLAFFARLAGMQIGESFKTGPATLQVVGHFNGNRSAFDSEIWMDSNEARSIFDRENFSSVLLRPASDAARERDHPPARQRQTLQAPWSTGGGLLSGADRRGKAHQDPRQLSGHHHVHRRGFRGHEYDVRSRSELARGRSARFASSDFDVRASSPAFWPKELFSRSSAERLGCAFSFVFNGWSVGTLSFETFSESVFDFRITPMLVAQGLAFSVVVGLVGSLLPAIRAARLPVISALKAT